MTGSRQQFTRTRTRRRVDFERVRQAVSAPGIDPRAWVAMARVDEETDDDQDVLVWDDDLGWIVDVTLVSGEGPITCRMGSMAQGSGVLETTPPRSGALVVVLFPNGDPNEDAIIVAQLTDIDGPGPSEINGATIVERDAADGQVAAIETHITVAPEEDLDQEWRNVRITAEAMTWGTSDADQPFVRGDDLADTLEDLIDAIGDFAQALATATPAPPNGALTVADVAAALPALSIALEQAKSAKDQYLSTRINGD